MFLSLPLPTQIRTPHTHAHTHTHFSLSPFTITLGPSPFHLIPSICRIALRAGSAKGGLGSCPRKNSPPPSLSFPPPLFFLLFLLWASFASRPFPLRGPRGASASRQDPKGELWKTTISPHPPPQDNPASSNMPGVSFAPPPTGSPPNPWALSLSGSHPVFVLRPRQRRSHKAL